MKILRVNDYRTGGGAELTIDATRRLLAKAGHEDHLFTIDDVPGHRRRPWSYIDNRGARRALAARLESLRPDLVHLHNFYHELSPGILDELIRYRRTHSLPVVMTAHDMHLACPNAGGCWFSPHNSWIEADPRQLHSHTYLLSHRWDHRGHGHSALRVAQHWWNYGRRDRRRVIDLVLCPSRFVKRMMEPLGLPAVVLPPPSTTHARPVAARDPRNLRLIFVGRIEPEKGLAGFLSILPGDFNGRLTIVGHGADLSRCRSIVQVRGLTAAVEFAGHLPHEQTLARIAESHVLIQPSLCSESYGRTLVEALSLDTNILVSNRGALREIVEDSGIGCVAALDDPQALKSALAEVQRQHSEDRLNSIDAGSFLESRGEAAYVAGLLAAYHRTLEGQPRVSS